MQPIVVRIKGHKPVATQPGDTTAIGACEDITLPVGCQRSDIVGG